LEMLLETKCYIISGKPHFRIHLKKKVVDRLGLQNGDNLLIDLKEVIRKQGDANKRYQVKLVEVTA